MFSTPQFSGTWDSTLHGELVKMRWENNRLHDFSAIIPRCYNLLTVGSF